MGTWIATAQFQPLGLLQASYYHKLSSQVEVAADLQLIAAPMKRDAVATIGAKWELRMATFRAQLDSGGKVSAALEQRFAPNFAFLFTGEIDHFKVSWQFFLFLSYRIDWWTDGSLFFLSVLVECGKGWRRYHGGDEPVA